MPRLAWMLLLILALASKPTPCAGSAEPCTSFCSVATLANGSEGKEPGRFRESVLPQQSKVKARAGHSPLGSDCPHHSPDDFLTLPSVPTQQVRGKICGGFLASLPRMDYKTTSIEIGTPLKSHLAGQIVSPRDRLHLICLLRC
jgi:hypothetical protein